MLAIRHAQQMAVRLPRALCSATGSHTARPCPPPASEPEQLLDAVLPHVAQHGWTDAAIHAGLRDLGWSPASAGLFPRGPASAVGLLVHRFNAELPKALLAADIVRGVRTGKGAGNTGMGKEGGEEDLLKEEAHSRAMRAIQMRISMAAPYRSSWVQALRLQAQPPNVKGAALASAKLADEVAHYAGYRKPDVRSISLLFSSPTTFECAGVVACSLA